MKPTSESQAAAAELRAQAEARAPVHAIQVHSIELEMQSDELRRAQVELEVSRARYFDLYDLAPVGYCTLSEAGLIQQANLTTATLLGVTRTDLVQRSLSRFIQKEDADSLYLLRKKILATGAAQTCYLRMVRSDGTLFQALVAATAAQDEHGAPTFRLVLSDITEHRQAEEVLREREELRWAILQTTLIGFWLADAQGRLQEVNAAYCHMSGYDVHELLRMHISELEDPSTAAATAAHLQHVMAGADRIFTCRHRRKNGTTFEVEVSFQFRPVAGGQIIVSLQDLSARLLPNKAGVA